MNKKVVALFIFAAIISGIFLVSSSLNEKDKIDGEVYGALKNQDSVRVMIKLKEPAKEKGFFIKTARSDKEIDQEKDSIKNSFLRSLDREDLRHVFDDSIAIEVSTEELLKLKENVNIESINVDKKIHAFLKDSVPYINASATWPVNISGKNITGTDETICVIDTGINFSHPALVGKNKTCIIDCYNKACTENCSIGDDNGHGTHVAGIAAASGEINGVAIGANLIGVKVLDSAGDGFQSDLYEGIDWCVANSESYNISVISMSLGDCSNHTNYCNSDGSSSHINAAVAKNISVIVSAGNGNSGGCSGITPTIGPSSPACVQNATAVGSITDLADTIYSSFQRGSLFELMAPGISINSTRNTGGYEVLSGTSMATPHVAGAFALFRQFFRLQNGRIPTPAEIRSVFNSTGKQINDTAGTGLNYSRIDVLAAIYSIDSINPVVSLLAPSNNTVQYTQNVTFQCSVNDVQLNNLTFYIWNSSGIYNNTNFVNLSGVNGNLNVNLTNVPGGNYHWSCLAYDKKGNSSFAAYNYSLGVNLKKMIVIGVDGFQYNHYIEMLNAGVLGNFTRLMANGGWNGTANITGHAETETKPGNAELHSGLNETLSLVSSNTDLDLVPNGNTTFERLRNFDSNIALGLIYGKTKSYIPNGVIGNALEDVDWWHNQTTYNSTVWTDGTVCDNSINVSIKATEFIGNYSNSPFYLFVYFGVPDCSGHAAGENSVNYNNSIINVDAGLGILLNYLEANNLNNSVQIIITADHGWNEGTSGHGTANADTIVLPLITNNATLVANLTSDGVREQCEISPTTLDYFGVPASDYTEIIDNGCGSMIGDLTAPVISDVSSSVSTTSATLNFLTSENSNSSANYGADSSLGTSVSNSSFSANHSVLLSGLSSSTVYYYNLTVCDSSGNCNTSGNYNLTTSAMPAPVVAPVIGGGGGGGTVTGSTYTLTQEQVSSGVLKELGKNDRIKFAIESENHTITLTSLSSNSVNLTIQSSIVYLSLLAGQEAKLNLTSSEYYDIYLKLDSIIGNKASLTIRSINERIKKVENTALRNETKPKNESVETTEKIGRNSENEWVEQYLYIGRAILIGVIVIIAILIIIKSKENGPKKRSVKKNIKK